MGEKSIGETLQKVWVKTCKKYGCKKMGEKVQVKILQKVWMKTL